jgi:xylulose-5-phosphate/fructose-6-phosphate phosphoketolase
MVMLNDLDRYHLVIDVIDRVPSLGSRAASLRQRMVDTRLRARQYTRDHGDDAPEIREWRWPGARAAGLATATGTDTGGDHDAGVLPERDS